MNRTCGPDHCNPHGQGEKSSDPELIKGKKTKTVSNFNSEVMILKSKRLVCRLL
jgi:hypothetical protein